MGIFDSFLTLFLVFLVITVDISATTTNRPTTADDLVNLVTRREWFSDNNVDYMLALDPFNAGTRSHLDVGPTYFGDSSTLNFFMSVHPTVAINGLTLFHAYHSGTVGAELNFKVVLKNTNTITITLGTKTFDVPKKIRSTSHPSDEGWDGTNPSLMKDEWNHINIDFVKVDAQTTSVFVHVNKRYWNNMEVNSMLLAGLRDNSFVGASFNSIKEDLDGFLYGYVDNFGLVGALSDTTWRKALRTSPFSIDTSRKPLIQLLLDFNDALVSVGTTTVAITKSTVPDVFWVVAELKNGAAFTPRSSLENWFECYATGDPHGYKRPVKMANYINIPNLEDQPGGKVFVRCGGDNNAGQHNASELEVRTYTRYLFWWRWSIFRLIAVRYVDWIYRINLDETASGIEHSTIGYITPKLNVPAGAYRKHISSSTWDPIPFTQTKVYHLEVTTGALYSYYPSCGTARSLSVKVPGIGSVLVDAPEATFSSCRYMNLYVTLNDDVCPDIKRTRSTCDNDLNVNADPLYRDWLPPPALPDNPEPNILPCTLVPAQFLNEVKNICQRIYQSDVAKRSDCEFDACAAGDIEVILLNRPTPECVLDGLKGNSTACSQLVCPNFCSYRGVCDTNLKKCTCDPGYVGKDCSQKASFSCYDLNYGSQTTKVSSQYIPVATTAQIATEFFGQFGAEGSALLYTGVGQNNAERLLIINNHATGPSAGSYNLCINVLSGSITGTTIIQKANPRCLGKHVTTSLSSNCYSFSWEPYGSGGLILDISSQVELEFVISNANGLKQVIYGSANGKGNLDVLKVPKIYHSSFKLKSGICNAVVCSIFDQQCKLCSDQPSCGYCVESGRCMLGDKSGPWNGICLNWRFTFEDAVSRVVTVEYDANDLVNPDTEVYLSTAGDGVPVNIYVPTLTTSFASDVLVLFSTEGDLAVNAQQFKRNFANLLGPFSSENVNFGLGFYDDTKASLTLSMTRADPNNFFTFTRALEATIGHTTSTTQGGQDRALSLSCGASLVNPGWRQHARKYAFITVYTHNPSKLSSILALRDCVLAANFLPVWVIIGNNTATRNFFQNQVVESVNGIPGFVLSMRNDGDDIYSVIRNGIRYGATLPSVVLKNTDASNNHVDFTTLNQQPETLFISGLSDVGLRAWFRIPMKRGDSLQHVAKIVVPGFGQATIADVSNTKPIATDRSFAGDEGTTCLQITLVGSSFRNLLPVIFTITSLPINGKLFEYDPSQPDFLGPEVGLGVSDVSNGTAAKLCFKPRDRFFHGLDSFTYQSFDGCSLSNAATVALEVRDIELVPLSQNTAFTFPEKQNASLSSLFKCTGGDAGETIEVLVSDITYTAKSFFEPVSTSAFSVGSQVLSNGWNGAPAVPVIANQFEMAVNGAYTLWNPFFWGTYNIKYSCIDSAGLISNPSNAVITITQVIDPPVIVLQDYTPIEDTWYQVNFDVKDFDVPLSTVTVDLQSNTSAFSIAATAGGSPLSFPYTCYSAGTNYAVGCSFFFKLAVANANSCPTGTGNCAINLLTPSVNLRVTASDGTLSSQSTISLAVYPFNDPPTIEAPSTVTTPEFTEKTFNVVLRDPDMEFNSASLTVINGNTEFSVVPVTSTTYSDRKEFTLKVVPIFNVYGNFHFQIKGFDGVVYSDTSDVEVVITYVNDAPTPSPVVVTLVEDIGGYVDITQVDPDNTPAQLSYQITGAIGNIPNTQIPKYIILDNQLNPISSTTVLNSAEIYILPNENYFTTVPDVITFSVTDTNLFGTANPNTVVSELRITVTPVNDPPRCVISNPLATEDSASVLVLQATQYAYGEDSQPYTAKVVRTPYSLSGQPDQGKFYQYDDRINTLSVAEFVAANGVILINDNDDVIDTQHRIIFVPSKDKSTDFSGSPLLLSQPFFDFSVFDGETSSVCQDLITIDTVNDAPVTWGNFWNGRTDLSYTGINQLTNKFEEPANNQTCYRLCKGIEDEPLQIFVGGQDIDYIGTSKRFNVIIKDTSSCPNGFYISYTKTNGDVEQIPSYPFELDKSIPAGVLTGLTFMPAPDTYNEANPAMIHPLASYSEIYCQVKYVLVDETGTESLEHSIDISIQEQNDPPLCVFAPSNISRCSFLKNLTIIGGVDGDFIYQFVEVIGYEDTPLFIYINFTDVEDDSFYAIVFECDPAFGKFFAPNDNTQHSLFLFDNGTINNSSGNFNNGAFRPSSIPCGPFSNGPYGQQFLNSSVAAKNANGVFRGYYVKFVPGLNEFGNLYNKLGIVVVDNQNGQSQFLLVYYFVTILPVNDRPTLFVKDGTSTKVAGPTVEYTIPTGTTLVPIVKLTDPDTELNVNSMTISVSLTTADTGASLIALDSNGQTFTISTSSSLTYTGTITQINQTLTSLTFISSGNGVSDITVYVSDNGATGNCPPDQTPQSDGSCPQTNTVHFVVSVGNNSISMALGITASAGLGGFLILAVAGAVVAVKRFKDKKTDSWKEFNEENFRDYGQANPIFEENTKSVSNPLYISSRESIELSNQ